MPDQHTNQPVQPSLARKKYKYTPYSIIAAPLAIPIGLELGKAIGAALEWSKAATVAAEMVIGALAALLIGVTINFFFGKPVEVTEKTPS